MITPYERLPPSVQAIARAQDRATHRALRLWGGVLCGFGAIAALAFAVTAGLRAAAIPLGLWRVPVLAGLVIAAIGAWLLGRGRRVDPKLETFAQPGARVAWVTVLKTPTEPFATLRLVSNAKDVYELEIDPEDAKPLLRAIAVECPQAVVDSTDQGALSDPRLMT